jgi:hypothetical protein
LPSLSFSPTAFSRFLIICALSVHVGAWACVYLSDFNSFGMHAKGDRHILNDCCHFRHFHHNLYARMHARFKDGFIFVRACARTNAWTCVCVPATIT